MSWGTFDIGDTTYDNKSFNYSSQLTGNFASAFLKPDGSKMYLAESATRGYIAQYSLSTADDVSTASYDSKLFDGASNISGFFIKPDGTKLYVCYQSYNAIYQYTLSTPWDISTATYDNKSFSIGYTQYGLFIKSDGTKLYSIRTDWATVYQYSMSTPWDISTAASDSKSFSTATQDSYPYSMFMNDTGTAVFVVGVGTGRIYQYTLSTAYDLSTANYADTSLLATSQDSTPWGVTFNGGGTKMYMTGYASSFIYQYTTHPVTSNTTNFFQLF